MSCSASNATNQFDTGLTIDGRAGIPHLKEQLPILEIRHQIVPLREGLFCRRLTDPILWDDHPLLSSRKSADGEKSRTYA
jgi:hypothetical protein